ncbi:hypothetical protein NDU88_005082 [Pleurodeles waltl]|uniref:Uncharacterized protein n=1 Tax=Pleurodeles waltl TaxID=8319 RepID=A0AAV7TUL8_PLEWA|nr:hypothetical protein NDU88_005082 [Pleurodeles waltl]
METGARFQKHERAWSFTLSPARNGRGIGFRGGEGRTEGARGGGPRRPPAARRPRGGIGGDAARAARSGTGVAAATATCISPKRTQKRKEAKGRKRGPAAPPPSLKQQEKKRDLLGNSVLGRTANKRSWLALLGRQEEMQVPQG